MAEEHQNLPDANRLSILSATILLIYALSPFFSFTTQHWDINLAGVIFPLSLNIAVLIPFVVAVMAVVGMDWLLSGHPKSGKQFLLQHELLPALTAWIIGIPLNTIKTGWQWWVVLGFGGILLILVFVSEYIAVDVYDTRHSLAVMGLTAVSFALFFFLSLGVYRAGLRLYLALPVLGSALALVVLRTLYLRLGGRWCISWTIGITLIIGQIMVGLHYLPVSPLSYGLILLGTAYSLTSLVGSIEERHSWRTLWVEPAIMLVVLYSMAYIFGR